MRVLFGMPSEDSLGGPIFCEPPFVEALRAEGVEADEEVYVYGECKTTGTMQRIRRVIAAGYRLRQRMRQSTYDVVHLNTSFDEKCVMRDLTTLFLIQRFRVPVYLKMHGSIAAFLETKSTFWRFLQRRVFAQAAGIGVLSNDERKRFIAAGCPTEKLSGAKLAIVGEYGKDDGFRAANGIDTETSILLFSSRFLVTKGLLDVITAAGLLRNEGRKFILYCLGDGPVRNEAETLAKKLDLCKHICFTGYIAESETAAFHANSDIFVFPTYHDEGFPIVILKSLAAGLPIITTQIRAAADYLTDPENCLWTQSKDPADLFEKIATLLDDPELRRGMSKNNKMLSAKFTPGFVAREYIHIYEGLLS